MSEPFPLTRAAFASLTAGDAALAHIDQLERAFVTREPAVRIATDAHSAAPDFDIVIAGGGLSLLYAVYLARRGFKVAVFDRGAIGRGHREWNISRRELDALAIANLFSPAEIDALIVHAYDHGIVRWHGGGEYAVRGVLDCVVDAETLLAQLSQRARAAGVTLFAQHTLDAYTIGDDHVRVEFRAGTSRATVLARLLLDATGASSPHARFDLVCPTVGGVLEGLHDVDARVGEILVTTEHVEAGHQHIWEGFPRGAGFTTYLFYYTDPKKLPPRPLWSLYERFFATRARYKRGEAQLRKPTYGFIPGYTRLRAMPTAPSARVLLVGDAAARHSPLTFCGFGSMVRSFQAVADNICTALERDDLSQRTLERAWHEPASLGVVGALTLMMMSGRRDAHQDPFAINELLDAAFSTLHAAGDATFAALLRDEISAPAFVAFMRKTAARRPTIYRDVFTHLDSGEIARWLYNLARFVAKGA